VKTYLARPWKEFSTTVFLNNYIDDFIQRDGYMIWKNDKPNIQNPYFAEFSNIGPGADATTRVKWEKVIITRDEAAWLNSTGIPYDRGFLAST
jgi:pectinesterase